MGSGRSEVRLIDRHKDGAWHGSLRNRFELSQARLIDWTLASWPLAAGGSTPSLLVSGFMRSGTTWVQECMAESLAAKTVFEPLSPLEPRRRTALRRGSALGAAVGDDATVQGAVPEPWASDDPAWAYLARACRGGSGSRFSMTCRRSRRESLSRAVVIKDVRLQFNLATFHDRFAVPVLHVTRDPRAVVASLLRAEWGWSYDDLSLDDVLPRSPEVWEHQPCGRHDVVDRFDRDSVDRIAAMWAVTERYVARSLDGKSWALRARYEDLAAAPASAFAESRRRLGLRAKRRCDFGRRSASSHPERPPNAAAAGLERGTLTDRDRSRILDVVESIHPGWDRGRSRSAV